MFERSEFEKFSYFNCFLLAWAAVFCELFCRQKSGKPLTLFFFLLGFAYMKILWRDMYAKEKLV